MTTTDSDNILTTTDNDNILTTTDSDNILNWTQLNGVWHNQLGSTMNLTARIDGSLTGTYQSRVGGVPHNYVLSGRFDPTQPRGIEGITLGWAVTYIFDATNVRIRSTATWSGQFFASGSRRIITHWLLTRSTVEASVWESTHVGTDAFTRTAPRADEIEKARELGGCSPDDIFACAIQGSE